MGVGGLRVVVEIWREAAKTELLLLVFIQYHC